jgi:radical SAM protein with 4Fe4S-binding SPASM domain
VKDAGIKPYMNITVGHYNAFSDDVESLCRYSAEHGYMTFVNVAIPSGCWKGNYDVMIDGRDKERLIELRKKYKNVLRDLWDVFDPRREGVLGCQTLNKLYVTPSGDVLPCSFVHIKIGSVYEKSLGEIIEDGSRVKYFGERLDYCPAGECREFAEKYMSGDMSMQRPADAESVFREEDFA